ncbi:MAG: trypsin-like peptidase domain-containing protein, partial [Acidimicrobiales bacterium]
MSARLRLAAMVIVGAVAASACGSDAAVDTSVAVDFSRPSVEAVSDSIVRIIGFGCGAPALGSGFAVEPNLIVTSGHLVTGRDPESLAVLRPSGDEYPATLVAFDADLDLAVLRVDDVQFEPVDLLAEVPLESGVAIGMRTASGVGVINEVEFEVDAPVIVNWDGVFRDTESQFLGIRIEAEIRRGDSGSALFVNDDTVIG